ncbi:MAG: 1-deoxy-D-xylulose-5-phosphate synthase [Actinomycetota bacterium]|nr:1-deoxy-D-xylulose-5-phosphate synthase [Actinomycetota bacterium]
MRHAFIQTLVDLALDDPSIVLLTGDLGYTVVEPFVEQFPERFFNVGVAEQNMLAVATGLASCGLTPYAYSIATFASMRGYEFFRNGPVLHDLPVRLVGVGGGLDYGHNGSTHYALEDIGIMRIQPGLTVVAPADPAQTRSAVLATAAVPGPVYLRLGKGIGTIPELGGRFTLGRAELLGKGDDVAIVTCGGITTEAIVAAELLAESAVDATVAVVASIAPPPVDDLVDLLGRVHMCVTLESHQVTGGLGSLVSEVVAEHGLGCRVLRRGMTSLPSGATGGPEYLHDLHRLSGCHVADVVLAALDLRR